MSDRLEELKHLTLEMGKLLTEGTKSPAERMFVLALLHDAVLEHKMSDDRDKEPLKKGAFTMVPLHEAELELLLKALRFMSDMATENDNYTDFEATEQLLKHLKHYLDHIKKRTAQSDPGTSPGDP